jgi:glycosyltransferase involved in cell wall biosynthesis
MITFKHEAYLPMAIKNVLEQNVNFEVELIVANDNSPDDSEVIVNSFSNNRKFHWIKYTRHKTNKGMMPNFIWALGQAQGKYIALCEGDDYWTDPYKLQKQVDFLESNPECNYLFTNRNILKINGEIQEDLFDLPQIFDLHFLLKKNIMPPTQTIMFENPGKKIIQDWEDILKYAFNGDWVLLFMIANNSKIGFINEFTAIYREGVGVISKTNNTLKFKNGLETNMKIDQKTNFNYHYHIGNYLFHYKNITYSYLENYNNNEGVKWFLKTELYYLTYPKKTHFFSIDHLFYMKHVLKILVKNYTSKISEIKNA